MLPHISGLGKAIMKSMEPLSHGLDASGWGSKNLVDHIQAHKTSPHIYLNVVPHVWPKV